MTDRIARKAIDRSVSHTEIVFIALDSESIESVTADLLAESDDSVVTERSMECWGTTEDGDEWRVHVRGEG